MHLHLHLAASWIPIFLAMMLAPAAVFAQALEGTLRGNVGANCFAQALGAMPFTDSDNEGDFTPVGSTSASRQATCNASRNGDAGRSAQSDAFASHSGNVSFAGTDAFGHTLVSSITMTLDGDANASASGDGVGTGSNAASLSDLVASFRVLRGTPVTVTVAQSGGPFVQVRARGSGFLPPDVSGGFSGVADDEFAGVEIGFSAGVGANTDPPSPLIFNGSVTATITFGTKPPQGACCSNGACVDEELQADCSGAFLGDQTVCGPTSCGGATPSPTPTATPPPTTTFTWTNANGGSYADVGNWSPPEEPGTVSGRNDTAVFDLAGSYDVAVNGARASRFVIRNGVVDLVGGTALVTGTSLAAPSLTVGVGGIFNLVAGGVSSVDVGIGEDAAGLSVATILGAGAVWTATGRFTVGHANQGSFHVTAGRLTSAEARIGGGPADGDAIVEGDLADWDTGNLGLGFGAAVGTLEIRAGGRVESDDAVIGAEPGSQESVVVVTGVGAQPSSWQVADLEVGAGAPGRLEVRAGGRLDFDGLEIGNGLQAPGTARIAGPSSKAIGTATSLANVGRLESGELVVEDGARMDAQTVFIGGGATGTAEVRGVNAGASSELNVNAELEVGVNASGTLRVSDRAKVTVDGDIFVGNPGVAPLGRIEIAGGGEVTGLSLSLFQGGIVIDGTAAVTSSPSLLLTFGDFTLRDLTTLEVRNGGMLNSVGTVAIDGIVEVAGVTPLGTRSTIAAPFGTLRVGDTTTAFFRIRDGGSVESVDGVIDEGSDVFVFGNPTPGAVDWKVADDFTIHVGSLQFCPGPGLVTVGRSITLEAGSVVKGNGTLRGPIAVNAGTVSPSCSIGTLVFDGAYRQTAQGRLVVEAAGPNDVDVLHVTGAATLAGTIEVRFVDGYLPAAGDFLPFLDVDGAIIGAFDRIVVGGVDEELVLAPATVGGVAGFTALTSGKACGGVVCERCDDCVDDDGDGLVDRADPDCAAAADGAGLGSGGDAKARAALGKCAATTAAVGAKLAVRVETTLQRCTDAMLVCLQTKRGDAACVAKAAAKCAKTTAVLGPAGAARSKARRTIAKGCGSATQGVPALATLLAAGGLGFGAELARCAAVGTPRLATVDDVATCIERATVCRASALFATRVPRAAELLVRATADPSLVACLPAATVSGAAGEPKTTGKPLVKCQKAIAAAGAKLGARLGKGYRVCAAAIHACVQSDDASGCLAKSRAACAKATRTLPTASGPADAKLLATIAKACGTLDPDVLASPDGLGFVSRAADCATLGVPALDGSAALATCLSREHACRAATLAEAATPRLREHLRAGAVALE